MPFEKFKDLLINKELSIKEVIKLIDTSGSGIAFVIDNSDKLKGTVTDGDIRRVIVKGIDVNSKVSEIMNKNPIVVQEEENPNDVLEKILKGRLFPSHYSLKIPVVNKNGKVVDVLLRTGFGDFKSLFQARNIPKPVNKVLIVGGAGYLGSVLCRKLLDQGYKVKVLDILMFGEESLLELKNNPNFEFVHGDMRNIERVSKSLGGVDAVILLAAIVGDPASRNLPENTIETNYLATMTLAQACKYHQINRFLFASTCSVYGTGDGKLDENTHLNPISLYARSKIDSEKGILSLVDDNFSPTILRMATLYGLSPRMRFDLVVNIFAMKSLVEKKIKIFGGDQWRPLLHVEDAADAFIKCLEAPIDNIKGEVFNVGSNEQNMTINQLGEVVKKIVPDVSIEKTQGEVIEGAIDTRDYNVSFDKIEDTLGFNVKKNVYGAILDIHQAIMTKKIIDLNHQKYVNCPR